MLCCIVVDLERTRDILQLLPKPLLNRMREDTEFVIAEVNRNPSQEGGVRRIIAMTIVTMVNVQRVVVATKRGTESIVARQRRGLS